MREMIEMISIYASQTVMAAGETLSCIADVRLQLIGACVLCAGHATKRCYEDAYLSLREPSTADKTVARRYCDKRKQTGFSRFGATSSDVTCSRSLGSAAGLQCIQTGLRFTSVYVCEDTGTSQPAMLNFMQAIRSSGSVVLFDIDGSDRRMA
jgi:hypothetical protein